MNKEKIPEIVHPSWHKHLQPLFDDDRMKHIKYNILPKCEFLPSPENIFRVFSMPMNKIKVVILGQDPYPNPGDATGLAFVPGNKKLPRSLIVIYKEILSCSSEPPSQCRVDETETGTHKHFYADIHKWEKQGVFLLNTALTVEKYNSGRHLRYWKWFTKKVIATIAENQGAIWLLWGKKAQAYEKIIKANDTFRPNYILKAAHPAAELRHGGKAGFYGCNHFIQINQILKGWQQPEIKF